MSEKICPFCRTILWENDWCPQCCAFPSQAEDDKHSLNVVPVIPPMEIFEGDGVQIIILE